MTDIEKIEEALYKIEVLFYNSPTYGLSLFKTLSLPEDDNDANLKLVEEFTETLKKQFEDESIVQYHIENLKYIRKSCLNDEEVKKILEEKANNIREKIAMDLIIHEDNLGLGGDFEPFDSEK